MSAWEAIAEVEATLPGEAAPDGEVDPRWQGLIRIADFIQDQPDAVWEFILRWGSHQDKDLRAAVATTLLEHLLERHFGIFFPKVETAVQNNVFVRRYVCEMLEGRPIETGRKCQTLR